VLNFIVQNVGIEDIIVGNGVSELIVMAMQGLLNNGDEVLVPAPDYPLWTGAVSLAGGRAVHYICDEGAGWQPDLDDMRAKITDKTRALVLINPNNPTGAVYPQEMLLQMLEIARQNNLIVFSDEIYDKILYDEVEHVSTASLADDLLIVTFNGLSKNYRLAGFRSGWMIISGAKHKARDYIEGLELLASMRMCANVPAMYAIQTALGGYQSIDDLVAPGGRLCQQRDIAWEMLNDIPGISCVKPQGALYCFPKVDAKKFNVRNDERLVLDLLEQQKILIVHGTAFNWPYPDHFRVVFLPRPEDLTLALGKTKQFFESYRQL
jgi:alanine-synthesizing transaminase